MAVSPRLFVTHPLDAGHDVPLTAEQAHYLLGVMRLVAGDGVRLFNGRDGEWQAVLAVAGKRKASAQVLAQTAGQEQPTDIWLLAAPLKRGRIDWVAEKACELGVGRLTLVQTRRAVVDRPNLDRLRAHMIEAAEQCGRTALPDLTGPVGLGACLAHWPADRRLLFCDETGGARVLDTLRHAPDAPAPDASTPDAHAPPSRWAVLIGPEGGFDPAERSQILACPQAAGVSLGPRILRADTAAVAAIALMQATIGDWI